MNHASTTTAPKLTAKRAQDFFGRLPGQTIKDFAAELHQLTPEDKVQLAIGLASDLTYI
jgi:hypothetical protein